MAMTETELDEIEARAKEANQEGHNPYQAEIDAEFLLAARQDVPALVAEVRRLRAWEPPKCSCGEHMHDSAMSDVIDGEWYCPECDP